MNRDDFRKLAAGHFVLNKPSIDTKELNVYVEGAVMAWDYLQKEKYKPQPTVPDQIIQNGLTPVANSYPRPI